MQYLACLQYNTSGLSTWPPAGVAYGCRWVADRSHEPNMCTLLESGDGI